MPTKKQTGATVAAVLTLAIIVGVFYPPAGEILVSASGLLGVQLPPTAEFLPDIAPLARQPGWTGTAGEALFVVSSGVAIVSVFDRLRSA